MCGIVGFLPKNPGQMTDSALQAMIRNATDSLTHRGPDGSGLWISPDGSIALGQRRLAVIDLTEGGRQPMHAASWVVVFNGEIYNYRMLRDRLRSSGHTFTSESDTEVLLALIQSVGVRAACRQMDGMFAFAAFHRETRMVWFARDRFGEKPLVLMVGTEGVGFSSEVRAFRHFPGFDDRLNPDAVRSYVRTGAMAGQSIFDNAYRLPAGSLVSIQLDHLPETKMDFHSDRYWDPVEAATAASRNKFQGSFQDAVSELDGFLRKSVASRSVADVPIGAFLSGGIDSSSVVAALTSISSDVRTYTIGSTVPQFDESADARRVANHLGTHHTEFIVDEAEALSIVPRLAGIFDEPFADSSQIPTLLVSELARRSVTVALTGDGGDELFGGYNRYTEAAPRWTAIERIPASIRRLLAKTITTVPPSKIDSFGNVLVKLGAPTRFGHHLGDKSHKTARVIGSRSAQDMFIQLTGQWNESAVLCDEWRASPGAVKSRVDWKQWNIPEAMMLEDVLGYLHDDILTKVDRSSMAVSLETRVPFLNPDLFSFAWSLPLEWRVNRGVGKVILREFLSRQVPASVLNRPKSGFGVPIGFWLRGALKPWASDLLSPERIRTGGVFRQEVVSKLWDDHLSGRRNNQHQLWIVLSFEAWRDRWLAK